MPRNFLTRYQDGLRDHRHITILSSHFNRAWFHFVLASMLGVCIIVSALSSASRANRVLATGDSEQAALAQRDGDKERWRDHAPGQYQRPKASGSGFDGSEEGHGLAADTGRGGQVHDYG